MWWVHDKYFYLSSKLQFRWLKNEWNTSFKKLKLLLTQQARVPKIETQAAHAKWV